MVLCLKTWESRSSPGLPRTEKLPLHEKAFGSVAARLRSTDAGWSSPVARQAHNLKAAGSNPAPATNLKRPMPASCKRGPNCPGLPTGAIPSRAPLSSLNVIHQRQLAAGGERAHFGEGATIEHARDRVARGDHDQPDRAGFEVAAIVARSIRRDRSAGDRS
jgi:hypothetical protein